MPSATPTRDCDVSKCVTGNLLIFKHMNVGASDLTKTPKLANVAIVHFETAFIMKECKDGSFCYNTVLLCFSIELDSCQLNNEEILNNVRVKGGEDFKKNKHFTYHGEFKTPKKDFYML